MRSAMRAASQLTGRGPTDVNVAPVPACLFKNPIMIYYLSLIDFNFPLMSLLKML